MRTRMVPILFAALLTGAALAWVDSRPGWDDTGVTAGALLASGALFGFLAPRGPWRWGLAIGGWIPALALARGGSPLMLLILAIPLAGAYGGAWLGGARYRASQ